LIRNRIEIKVKKTYLTFRNNWIIYRSIRSRWKSIWHQWDSDQEIKEIIYDKYNIAIENIWINDEETSIRVRNESKQSPIKILIRNWKKSRNKVIFANNWFQFHFLWIELSILLKIQLKTDYFEPSKEFKMI
jgi:hypothetical protein